MIVHVKQDVRGLDIAVQETPAVQRTKSKCDTTVDDKVAREIHWLWLKHAVPEIAVEPELRNVKGMFVGAIGITSFAAVKDCQNSRMTIVYEKAKFFVKCHITFGIAAHFHSPEAFVPGVEGQENIAVTPAANPCEGAITKRRISHGAMWSATRKVSDFPDRGEVIKSILWIFL
jgi:hypothetical protein